MEQTIPNNERPLTAARIKSLPAYRLTGVSEDAVPVIKDTGFWVHYRSFGMDGWYIAAPDAVLPHFKAVLAEAGVGLEGVKRLPRKYGMLPCMMLHIYMMFGWIAAAAGVAHMGKVWLAVTVAHLFMGVTGVYTGRPAHAEMLECKAVDYSDHNGVDDWLTDTPNPDIPGSYGWRAGL